MMNNLDDGKSTYIVGNMFIDCTLSDILQDLEDGTQRIRIDGMAFMPIPKYKELEKAANSINPFPKLWKKLKNDPS